MAASMVKLNRLPSRVTDSWLTYRFLGVLKGRCHFCRVHAPCVLFLHHGHCGILS